MVLRLRQYDEILSDMINHVAANTNLTDFNVGSVIRTILEAASLEDEEQYFQMAQLLKMFALKNLKGQDLLRRAQDYGINGKLPTAPAAVEVTARDGSLVKDVLGLDMSLGSYQIQLVNTLGAFVGMGPAFTVRLGEGTSRAEDVEIVAVDVSNAILHMDPGTLLAPLPGTVNQHYAGERISLVTGLPDRAVAVGTLVQRPRTTLLPSAAFIMQGTAVIANGNYESPPVMALAAIPGTSSRVGAGQINSFVDGPPFEGAEITNVAESTGGSNTETDAQLQNRVIRSQQIKTAATVRSLESNLVGLRNEATGQIITTVKVKEDFDADVVRVFIDDSTGLVPDREEDAVSSLTVAITSSSTVPVVDITGFPDSGFVLIEHPTIPANSVVCRYKSKSGSVLHLDDYLADTTGPNDFPAGSSVKYVHLIEESSEPGQTFVFAKQYPLEEGSIELFSTKFDNGASDLYLSVAEITNFTVNLGSGQFQLAAPLPNGRTVFVRYTYLGGIMNAAQVVLNGDPKDILRTPGVRAQGIRTVVEVPVIVNVVTKVSITAEPGFNETDLRPRVKEAIILYINGLSIGEDVILSEIIRVSQDVDGVLDTSVVFPEANIIASEFELCRIDDEDVLVT